MINLFITINRKNYRRKVIENFQRKLNKPLGILTLCDSPTISILQLSTKFRKVNLNVGQVLYVRAQELLITK